MSAVSGKRWHQVTIERNVGTRTARGAESDSWQQLCRRRARRQGTFGREVLRGAPVSQTAFTFELRSDRTTRAITAKDRIREGTQVWDIAAVWDPDGRRQWIKILTASREDDGR